ncbi:MAG: fatty acid--CoA ligase family protein [Verrucomicrobiota bacterium]|nr:fatty acid--CoA ligase family protein [Verrucomicrobiota bacterium]
MLYAQWQRIVAARAEEVACWDIHARRQYKFREIQELVDARNEKQAGMATASGADIQFFVQLLLAWRDGVPFCPLEPGQLVPRLHSLPPWCAHVKLTSGSTGKAKAVLFTERQLKADVDQIVATMGLQQNWPNLGVISLAHSYGFSNLALPLLLHGIPLILAGAPLPETVLHGAGLVPHVTIPAVPAIWRSWLETKSIPVNCRLAISAGAPLRIGLEQEIYSSTGLKVHNFYGASECGGIAYDRSTEPRKNEEIIGQAMNGVRLSISEEGCLAVQSEAVGECYWPAQSSAIKPGLFYTEDLAEIRNGVVHLRGRKGDLINVAGRKVAPEQIEEILRTFPAVKECVVFGIPEKTETNRGEWIVACVNVHPGTEIAQLRNHLLQQIPAWQLPREWWFEPTLKVNLRGKLSRAEWRNTYLKRNS